MLNTGNRVMHVSAFHWSLNKGRKKSSVSCFIQKYFRVVKSAKFFFNIIFLKQEGPKGPRSLT